MMSEIYTFTEYQGFIPDISPSLGYIRKTCRKMTEKELEKSDRKIFQTNVKIFEKDQDRRRAFREIFEKSGHFNFITDVIVSYLPYPKGHRDHGQGRGQELKTYDRLVYEYKLNEEEKESGEEKFTIVITPPPSYEDISEVILPDGGEIYISNYYTADNRDLLHHRNIKAIISIGSPPQPDQPSAIVKYFTIDVHHIIIDDCVDDDISIHFDKTFQFIEEQRRVGNKVLVHCFAGISRSATILISYLIRKYQMTHHEAENFLRTFRRCINPNEGFRKQLEKYYSLQIPPLKLD